MELNAIEIVDRLITAFSAKNAADLAKKIDSTSAIISAWKKRNTIPYKEVYETSRTTGYSMDWILTGQGMKQTDKIQVIPEDNDYCHISQYSIEASAGQGALVEAENIDQHLAFKESWLRKSGINPANLIAIYARGDSMEPTIFSGDSLVIDKTKDTVTSDGGVYVINYDGELFVKRVQKQLDGLVAITSDNKNYQPMTIPIEGLTKLKIIGRVVWSGHPMI
ncbi:LexA family transcriptional regulator [Marinomonas transparens]|uniref:Helix-turn-helix transcriptional regulator n=1 Tax=Marinomonas transparens TaxID=2795388 RepID=A0A934JNX7_9GAMM|nr:helix-turn-helix transcriptional regulator [Marinomonas transparens]MBJ7539266.1 helix-turn-helix transcriptional regulator [Marinomonas transparens]